MNIELPTPIAAFFQAHNTGKTDDFRALFAEDAVVCDEDHEYRGDAIKGWIDAAIAKYQPHAEIISLVPDGEQTVATARVSGSFLGSPVQLHYQFTLRDDQIAALTIGT
jgi:hypothetical protein